MFNSKNYSKIEDLLRRYYITSQNLQTDKGDSLLAMAANMGDPKMVRILLLKGMDPNTQNKNGDTPLHYAINKANLKIADMLIENGADENIKNCNGLSPWAHRLNL